MGFGFMHLTLSRIGTIDVIVGFFILLTFYLMYLVLDDLKTDIVEVKLWDKDTAGAYPAVREECYIEVVSYGGDTTGYQIPFNVHYTGVKTKGTFDPATKKFTQAWQAKERLPEGCPSSGAAAPPSPEGEGFEERRVRWS